MGSTGRNADSSTRTLAAQELETGPVLDCGDIIGRYVVLHVLGSGGMGVIAAAYDPDLDRQVALKLILPERWQSAPKESRRRLVREARALARLAHPNVVAVYDIGLFSARPYIAMELIPGVTLRQWLSLAPRTWPQVVRVFIAAGRGLSAAHRAGIVHRDIKPHNVLVAGSGRVVLADFGLALLGAGTQARSRSGTLAYMAPEQHLGDPADARSDQFSYCVALYEALYGERPFAGKSPAELAAATCRGQLGMPPRGVDIPAWLHALIIQGLAVDPGLRFASMDTLVAALSAGLLGRNTP